MKTTEDYLRISFNESLNIFCGWIYKSAGQTIFWKGGEGATGDDSLKKVITFSVLRMMTEKKVTSFEVKQVTPSVTTPDDSSLSDTTARNV